MQFDGQWSRSGLLLWLHLLFYFSPQQVSLDEILYVSLIMTPLTGIEILLKQVYRCMCVWKSVSAFPVFRIVPVHHRHQIDTYWMNEWMNACIKVPWRISLLTGTGALQCDSWSQSSQVHSLQLTFLCYFLNCLWIFQKPAQYINSMTRNSPREEQTLKLIKALKSFLKIIRCIFIHLSIQPCLYSTYFCWSHITGWKMWCWVYVSWWANLGQ